MSNQSPLESPETSESLNDSPLNARQELFIQEYLKDLNATQAAIRAGYAEIGAAVTGHRLLRHPKIAPRVEQAKMERMERVKIESDDVLSELLIVLKSDVDNYVVDGNNRLVPREGISPKSTKAISSVRHKRTTNKDGFESEEIEYKLWDKTRAIEMGMKHLGLMFDRLKIEDADDVLAKVLGVEKEKLPE